MCGNETFAGIPGTVHQMSGGGDALFAIDFGARITRCALCGL